jgi:hypothetical protein
MKKILVISSFIFSALFADNSLGTPLSTPVLKPQHEIKSYNKNVDNTPKAKPTYSKRKFRKDDHRYDKRYNNFDYETHGYYNDEGYYYGYYDTTGYFYNNIFFTYNNRYTYYDREHLRGYFQPYHQHYRVYEYHRRNNWNRVHRYREPNCIIYGHYYDRPSYRNSYRSNSNYYNNSTRHYNNDRRYSRDTARMHTNRNSTYRRESDQRDNHYINDTPRYNEHRNSNYRNQNHSNHNSYQNRNERRSDTRMRTRSSSDSHRTTTRQNHNYGNKSNQHSTSHMQLSR